MTRVAVPNLGNYTIALAASVKSLGVQPWSCPTTPETMRLGLEAAPETICLPFKASLGHFIKAAQEGVEYGIIVNSIGTCRLRYYRTIQQKIIDNLGLKMHIFGLGYDGFKPPLIRYFDPSLRTFLKGVVRAASKLRAVDQLELEARRKRAVEIHSGDTTRLMKSCLNELEIAQTAGDVRRIRNKIPERFAAIPAFEGINPLRVALVGEASVLRDQYLNHNIEEILGGMGIEVFNFFLLYAELRKIFHLEFGKKLSRKKMLKMAHPYLKSLVGGHALETIAHTLHCSDNEYDGVIHICPSGCMPEVSIRPILRKVNKDCGIPVLECTFDEHSSHVGVVTRIEAFVDILHEKRKRKRKWSV